MTAHSMTCDRFEALLGDFLEEGLDPATREACEAHRTACATCAALVADLDTIVAAAARLPAPAPSRDLWPAIETRLETPVVPLDHARAAVAARTTFQWRRLAVAAVALVTVSAGVTWTLARPDASPLPGQAVRDAAVTGAVGGTVTGTLATTVADAAPPVALDTLYGREIALLRDAAEGTLGRLDSGTVQIVRRNLDIIDQAIRESREALAADPNSGFLLEQLDHAYERKVELLRRLAML